MGRGELLLWGCSQITNADACLLSTQNTLRFSVLYTCMLTCWQTNHTSKVNPSSPERFLTDNAIVWMQVANSVHEFFVEHFRERKFACEHNLWKNTLQMHPTLGTCISFMLVKILTFVLSMQTKLAQLKWFGQETSILCLMEKFMLGFQAESFHYGALFQMVWKLSDF